MINFDRGYFLSIEAQKTKLHLMIVRIFVTKSRRKIDCQKILLFIVFQYIYIIILLFNSLAKIYDWIPVMKDQFYKSSKKKIESKMDYSQDFMDVKVHGQ